MALGNACCSDGGAYLWVRLWDDGKIQCAGSSSACIWSSQAGCGTNGVAPPDAPGGIICPSANYGGWCSAAAVMFRTGVPPSCPAPPPPPPPPPASACNGWTCMQSSSDAAPNWVAVRPGMMPRKRTTPSYTGIQCLGPNALTAPCAWVGTQAQCIAATCSTMGAGPGGQYCTSWTGWCGQAKKMFGM